MFTKSELISLFSIEANPFKKEAIFIKQESQLPENTEHSPFSMDCGFVHYRRKYACQYKVEFPFIYLLEDVIDPCIFFFNDGQKLQGPFTAIEMDHFFLKYQIHDDSLISIKSRGEDFFSLQHWLNDL